MKVFLLFPDRDFDPKVDLPANHVDLTKDLELQAILDNMAMKDKFILQIAKQTVFTGLHSIEEIKYRQEILKDCINNPEVIRELYKIPIQSTRNKQNNWLGIYDTHHPSSILLDSVQLLNMFLNLLKKLRHIADISHMRFNSRGFKRFFAMIRQDLPDDYFEYIEEILKELRFFNGTLLSAELGTGNEGTNYILRKEIETDQTWKKKILPSKSGSYSFTLDPKDNYGTQVLRELKDEGINDVANAVAQSADHIDSFINVLQNELAFYIGCLNLYDSLKQYDEPITFPNLLQSQEFVHNFTGLYDLSLALTLKQKVIGNDFTIESKSLVIITGANQGGKSTFLRSIGIAQLLMQCGMFVPAESFTANLCENLFTHFKREEDSSMKSGKLDEELERMSTIIDTITPYSMILFNESFASTNEREGSEIAFQILDAFLKKHIKVFFVTHLYYLANKYIDDTNKDIFFIRAPRQSDGSRTFKLIESGPLETSFGKDIYVNMFEGPKN